jgi:hypothetical protein
MCSGIRGILLDDGDDGSDCDCVCDSGDEQRIDEGSMLMNVLFLIMCFVLCDLVCCLTRLARRRDIAPARRKSRGR